VEVTLEFKDFEVGGNRNRMRVHYWDKNKRIWKRVPGRQVLDTVTNTIMAKVKHFTVFGVLEVPETAMTGTIGAGWNMVGLPVKRKRLKLRAPSSATTSGRSAWKPTTQVFTSITKSAAAGRFPRPWKTHGLYRVRL